ncbi:MAG: hypothetical protein JEZ03_16885 [Bacteroidales bacterium]|nr:hypothetical protein [Bacteroidales bacterium]
MDFRELKYFDFVKLELSDRLKHKGLGRMIWNIFMFPFTSNVNYFIYRKWIKIKNTITDLIIHRYINIEIQAEQPDSISLKKGFDNYGKNRLVINSNRAHFLQTKNYLFVFPFKIPKSINDFYTMYESPFRIRIDNLDEKYRYLDIPTVDSIRNIEKNDAETIIDFISPDFDENIKLTIRENITIANNKYT